MLVVGGRVLVFCEDMSSHHFVREGQEPALLILDIIPWETIGSLLEWAPLVIATDAALETALHWGIKIDAVVASPDRAATLDHLLTDHCPVRMLTQAAGTDALSVSLDHLIHTRQSAVNITAADPFPVIAAVTQHAPPLNISIITPTHRWSLFKSGTYKKWHPAHTTLQVHQSGNTSEITTPADGLITLEPNTPFWMGENL